jgi:hypothetical protein
MTDVIDLTKVPTTDIILPRVVRVRKGADETDPDISAEVLRAIVCKARVADGRRISRAQIFDELCRAWESGNLEVAYDPETGKAWNRFVPDHPGGAN